MKRTNNVIKDKISMSPSPAHKKNSKVIINADDFGITQGVNKAIIELADAGIVTSTTVMSNMPHYRDIATLKNKVGIGIHFNLTTGQPVLESRKVLTLINDNGTFFDLTELIKRVHKGRISKREVELELKAQIEKLTDLDIKLDHVDSHESILKYPFFMSILKRVAKKYGIMAVRTYSALKFDYSRLMNPRSALISAYLAFQKIRWRQEGFRVADKYDSLIKFGLDYRQAIEKLRDIFNNAPHGILELATHPGYCDGDSVVLGEYVREREVELQALLSDEFKNIVMNPVVELISYRDIKSQLPKN